MYLRVRRWSTGGDHVGLVEHRDPRAREHRAGVDRVVGEMIEAVKAGERVSWGGEGGSRGATKCCASRSARAQSPSARVPRWCQWRPFAVSTAAGRQELACYGGREAPILPPRCAVGSRSGKFCCSCNPSNDPREPRPGNILVCDDSLSSRMFIQVMLEPHHHCSGDSRSVGTPSRGPH